jgi:hypothetical protein
MAGEDQRPQAPPHRRHVRLGADRDRHRRLGPGSRRGFSAAGPAARAILHDRPGLGRRRLCRPPGELGIPGPGPHGHHRQTQRRHHRIRRATPPLGRGTNLRRSDALPPPSPRLRTTTRTPRSHGAVGHRRDHDPATGPHHGRSAASSPMGQTPRRSLNTQTTRSASRVTIYQQALTYPPTTSLPPGQAAGHPGPRGDQ